MAAFYNVALNKAIKKSSSEICISTLWGQHLGSIHKTGQKRCQTTNIPKSLVKILSVLYLGQGPDLTFELEH